MDLFYCQNANTVSKVFLLPDSMVLGGAFLLMVDIISKLFIPVKNSLICEKYPNSWGLNGPFILNAAL